MCEHLFVYSRSTVERALQLAAVGMSPGVIGDRLGVSRSTIVNWLADRLPRTVRLELCDTCGAEAHANEELGRDYSYLLGLYLGDGCISKVHRGVQKLRITLDAKYPGIVAECERAILAVVPRCQANRNRHGSDSCVEVYSYSKSWGCLFPQHGPGKKHERRIQLTPWQRAVVDDHPEQLLRGLIHSDGCRFQNTGTNWSNPRYSFSNRSADIRRIFCDACDRLGLRRTTAPHTVYVSRKADVARMDQFIGPKS